MFLPGGHLAVALRASAGLHLPRNCRQVVASLFPGAPTRKNIAQPRHSGRKRTGDNQAGLCHLRCASGNKADDFIDKMVLQFGRSDQG
ncbi:uncharacterized protein BDV17DRAFT_252123 [Aspergillus undulatus]|uniref:uncharacterized protein n=1 Tax=Aspergillus undulatus TaxID=1810928 RepID=UPI003CCD854D